MNSMARISYLALAALFLFAVGCGGESESSESDPPVVVITGSDDAGTETDTSSPDAGDEQLSIVGGTCISRSPADGTDDVCDIMCQPHDWTCDYEEVNGEVTAECDGYCTRTCSANSPCPDGFSCRDATGRDSMRCLKDGPLDGEFSDRTPADGAQFAEGDQVRLEWTFADDQDDEDDARYYDLHWGPSPDDLSVERASRAAHGKTGWYDIDASDLQDGQQVYWKVVATGNGGLQAESSLWSFTVEGESDVQTPCPDEPTVTIDGRNVGTVQIRDKCWTKGSFRVGEPLGGTDGDTYYNDGQVQHGFHSNAYFYSWWEAHNDYPLDASLEPQPNQVGDSICPDGWSLPTRNEWTLAVNLGNEMQADRQSNALDYGWVGWFSPNPNDVSECPNPDGQGDIICGRFGDRVGSNYMFLVSPNNWTDSIPIVSISRPSGGSTDFVVEQSNSGSPWSGYQVRCVRD
jgi:uncharacterized protein (TIGR02145 family)